VSPSRTPPESSTSTDARFSWARKTLEDLLLTRLKAELERPEVVDYIARELRGQVEGIQNRTQERQRLGKELEAERRKLQNLVAALEDGRSSSTILEAIQKREANIQRLQAALTTLGRERRPISVTPEWITSQLSDLSSLLTDSGEKARNAFRKLALDIRLHPVRPEGENAPTCEPSPQPASRRSLGISHLWIARRSQALRQ
jgi:chromosome segregation ATPase